MTNFKDYRIKLCALAALAFALLLSATAAAGYDPDFVRTESFPIPMDFGIFGQGMISEDAPFAGREVIEVRITWDVVIAEGYDAANIMAEVWLPIIIGEGSLTKIDLNGPALGWSGSGTFRHSETTNKYNSFFGQVSTRWGWQALGIPHQAGEVLKGGIEVDYIVPEPATMSLLALGGLALLRRRK